MYLVLCNCNMYAFLVHSHALPLTCIYVLFLFLRTGAVYYLQHCKVSLPITFNSIPETNLSLFAIIFQCSANVTMHNCISNYKPSVFIITGCRKVCPPLLTIQTTER